MSPRAPKLLLQSTSRSASRAPWICRSCLSQAVSQKRRCLLPKSSWFSTSTRYLADSLPNHYEALQLPHTASAADIKRQFYTLSKQHHPDRNPDDPTASTRFVAISEAYHVLAVPEKRAHYDAQLSQSQGSRWGRGASHPPQGSFSSASYAGSRPASGLSKKRGTFRGPPPSFYKSGGYGKHGAKRAEYAHHQHAGAKNEDAGRESYGGFAGFGPGQTQHGSQVPHFDDQRHKEAHDHVNEHIHARRRRTRATEVPEDFDRGGMIVNFILVAGAVGIIGLTAKLFGDKDEKQARKHGG